MLEARLENLNGETQDKLRRFLTGELFGVLTRVAKDQASLHQVNALRAAVEAAKGSPLKIEATGACLQAAARYATFVDVLTEFKEQTTPFQTVKVTST